VAGHERKLGNTPFIVKHAQITVADTAVFNFYFYLVMGDGTWIIFEGFQLTTGFKCSVCFNHFDTSLTYGERSHADGLKIVKSAAIPDRFFILPAQAQIFTC
jgi:hypothetical protein